MSFQWDGVELKSVNLDTDGPVVATLQVPAGADARTHDVVASCGREHAQSTFVVVVPATQPTLTLVPEKGGPETHITAAITDFGACGDGNNPRAMFTPAMPLQWDGTPLTPTSTVNGDKDLKLEFPVPASASAGEHQVTVPCGNARLRATFTVTAPENPALALTPARGGPETQATATPTGFGACRAMSFQWDGRPLPTFRVGSDSLVVNFAVPKDASDGDHKVTATCGNTSAPATFTVVSAPKPTLTLDTGHGPGGSHLTASGTGFACGDGNVQLLWDDDIRLTDAPSDMFSAVPLTIPSGASTGLHMVAASCEHHPDIADNQRFTVTSVTTSVTNGPAALTLQPTSGHPGDQLRATGDGFACANHSGPVNLSWDDGTLLPGASLDPSGHFEASVSVPAKADARRLTLRATCSDGIVLAADFTLLASPPPPPLPPPPPPPKIPWLLIGLIAAGAILSAVEYARRRRHKRPEAPPHVQAVPHPDGSPVLTMSETPECGEATHALRLEAHSGISTLTVREVDG
jgi:hypothetical protein